VTAMKYAPGAVMAAAHIATTRYAGLIAAWRSADLPAGRDAGHRLAPLSAALFAAPNPAVIKAVLHAEGRIPSAAVRLPLTLAAPELTARALAAPELTAPALAAPELAARALATVSDQGHRPEPCREPVATA
jgi:4-hydroxy-tetrahydrodipicolinate synthase